MSLQHALWLREALKHAGMEQQELADELTKRLNRQFRKSAINKMAKLTESEKTKRQKIKADEMFAISDITGYPALNETGDHATKVKLLDLISAGKLWQSKQIFQDDIIDELTISGLGKGNWVALKVDGDSMDKIAPSGSIIFVDRTEMKPVPGKLYVFQDEEGNGTFKMFRDNKPRMVPVSNNSDHEPQFFRGTVRVIGRVKKALIDLD